MLTWDDAEGNLDVSAMRADAGTLCVVGQRTADGVATPFIVVFDAEGSVTWESTTWPASQGGRAHDCDLRAGTLVVAAGEERAPATQGSRGWIRVYDETGTELWRETFESQSDDAARGVALVGDVAVAAVWNEAFVQLIGYELGGARRWRHAIEDPRQVTALGSSGSSVVVAGVGTGDLWIRRLSP